MTYALLKRSGAGDTRCDAGSERVRAVIAPGVEFRGSLELLPLDRAVARYELMVWAAIAASGAPQFWSMNSEWVGMRAMA
jgi:hypothetical protein